MRSATERIEHGVSVLYDKFNRGLGEWSRPNMSKMYVSLLRLSSYIRRFLGDEP